MSRRGFVWTVLLWVLLPTCVVAQERWLRGKVVYFGEHDAPIPEVNLTVTIAETGNTATTNSGGLFRIVLPEIFKSGDRVTLQVDKPGWRIYLPVQGETRVPAEVHKELVEVRLLPVGSKLFWSHQHIEKLFQDLAEQSKQQLTADNTPVDFGRYIKDWAVKYGFSAPQAKEEIDRWIAEVKANEEDPSKLGLAAFAEKNFHKASQLFTVSAEQKTQRLAALRQEEGTLLEEIVRDFRLAGDAHANAYLFAEALTAYERALSYVDKTSTPQLWAATLHDLGGAHWQLGIRAAGTAIHDHLGAALQAFRQALEVYTRAALPQDWAMTQNNLGIALRNQGMRTAGEGGAQLLAEAVAAYRQALEVYTRTALPQDWAMTQNNLGVALRDQGTRTAGEGGAQLLAEAVAAYRQALEVRTVETLPPQWAQTHNNLAKALLVLQDWSNAVISYVNVLRLYPDDREAYEAASSLLHDKLFQFPAAFTVDQEWLERHPDDVAALSNFAAKHFTTGRFAECAQRLAALLANPDLPPQLDMALRALEVAALLALDNTPLLSGKMDTMLERLAQQPETFQVTWSFAGTLHFIRQHAPLAPYGDWQQQWFRVFTATDRQSLVTGLHAARASIPAGSK